MTRRLLAVFILCCVSLASLTATEKVNDPKADDAAVVVAGNARFTVLTPQMIRMEWSEDGVFEDRATLTFVNRKLDVPEFKVKRSSGKVVIKTSAVTLTYKMTGRFTDENLKAEFKLGDKKVVWTPSLEDTLNLMGTTRTLDKCDGNKLGREPMDFFPVRAGLLWTIAVAIFLHR